MPARIETTYSTTDARAKNKHQLFQRLGVSGTIKKVQIVDSYLVDMPIKTEQLKKAGGLFVNPLIENYQVNSRDSLVNGFDWVIEIGFLPGVTDNVGHTAKESIEDFLKKKFKTGSVHSSQIFFLSGKLKKDDVEKISQFLFNPLIQWVKVSEKRGYLQNRRKAITVPKVKLSGTKKVTEVNLNVTDTELFEIGKLGIKDKDGSRRGPLSLDPEYMVAIRDYFKKLGRNPTDIELEALAQTWSEHCKHTIFASPIDEIEGGLYKQYIKKATNIIRQKKGKNDFCVSVFTDNSGIIKFDDNFYITHKVETHNSPSALDPFGGAITGIVGVNRDTIGSGMGAKPIINTYGFCFADPKDKRPLYRDKNLTQRMLPPARIMEGVIHGVNVGGNCSGIPTAQGFVYFDERFRGKPLVFVGTAGLLPKEVNHKPSFEKEARPGDYIVMVGGRVGLDGIHGATFSSVTLDSNSPAAAVQIGDPITQKKFSDAIVKEARDQDLYSSITDNGAGGLSSSVLEMARESGGCVVNLEKVPLKYPGLAPWQIWISESQERMTLSVPKNKWLKFSKLMESRGVEAAVIGEFTKSGRCLVKYGKEKVIDLDMEFLHNGVPTKHLKTLKPAPAKLPSSILDKNLTKALLQKLKDLNITSYEFISKQYDHEVQGSSVIKPLQGAGRVNGEAAVMRPVLNSPRGVVLSTGVHPEYSENDSYAMAGASIDSAISAAVAAGADVDNLALLDNFCWCSSNEPERLYQLKRAVEGCFDFAIGFETPFISGKDSMFNDFKGFDQKGNPLKISVPPTLLVSAMGVIPDISKAVSIDTKLAGDLIYILGKPENKIGVVPTVDPVRNRKIYADFFKAAQGELISSAISVSRGGIAVALAKMSIAGQLGCDVNSDENILFANQQGLIIVTVDPKNKDYFENILAGNPLDMVGQVTDKDFKVRNDAKKILINSTVTELERAYKSTFKNF